MSISDKYIRLTDLYAASFLVVSGISLIGINKSDSSDRLTFVFPNSDGVEKLLDSYTQLKARVEPMSYVAAQKKLKQMLYLPERK